MQPQEEQIRTTYNKEDLAPNQYDETRIRLTYQFPASSKAAQVHRRANKFGYNAPKMADDSRPLICPCCQSSVNTVPIDIFYGVSPKKPKVGETVFLLNPGTSLYFNFIKMCIYYLILRFFIYDAYNIFSSYQGHFCKDNPHQCTGEYTSFLSGYNKHSIADSASFDLSDYLELAVTILSMVFFYFCRKSQFRINSLLDRSNVSQDEFSIFIHNIPIFIYEAQTTTTNIKFQYEKFLNKKITQHLTTWIDKVKAFTQLQAIEDDIQKDFYRFIVTNKEHKQKLDSHPIVASINLCYDLSELNAINNLRTNLMKQCANDENINVDTYEKSQLLQEIPNQIQVLNHRYIVLSKKFALDNSPEFNVSHFLGKAFVSFEYQHYREYFLRQYEKDNNFFKINQIPVRIEKPAKPNDVEWKNLNITNQQRSTTVRQSFFVLGVLLLFFSAVLLGIQELQIVFDRKSGEGPQSDFQDIKTYLRWSQHPSLIIWFANSNIQFLQLLYYKIILNQLFWLAIIYLSNQQLIISFLKIFIIYLIICNPAPNIHLVTFVSPGYFESISISFRIDDIRRTQPAASSSDLLYLFSSLQSPFFFAEDWGQLSLHNQSYFSDLLNYYNRTFWKSTTFHYFLFLIEALENKITIQNNFYILYDTSDIANKISNKLTSHMQEDLMDKLSQLKQLSGSFGAVKSTLVKFSDLNYLKQQFLNYLFVVLLPAITNFLNFMITMAIERLTKLQCHETKTHHVSSFIMKNIASRFINTVIMYYLLSILHPDIGPLTQEGFVTKVMSLVGVSALSQMVTQFVRPEEIYAYIFLKKGVKEVTADMGDVKVKDFQRNVNKAAEDPQFGFTTQYTFYIIQMFLVSFYAVMVPSGVGILVLIFIIQYWIDKYNLFNKCSIPIDFDFYLTRIIFKFFEASLLIFTVGCFVFDQQIRVDQKPRSILIHVICIGLSATYLYISIFLPQRLSRIIFDEYDDLYHKSYSHFLLKKTFKKTYWTQNPATAFLKQKKLDSDNGYVENAQDEGFATLDHYNDILNMKQADIKYDTFEKEQVDYFDNYDKDGQQYNKGLQKLEASQEAAEEENNQSVKQQEEEAKE